MCHIVSSVTVVLWVSVWVLKKVVVHFGLKSFAERTLASWWAVLQKLGREREEALLPGPIKGLAQFMLRVDTKVTSLTPPPIYHNILVDFPHDITAAVVTVTQLQRYRLWDEDEDCQR